MPKTTTHYVCQSCGAVSRKWNGKCDACQGWNTLIEEEQGDVTPKGLGRQKGRKLNFVSLSGTSEPAPRRVIGIEELDRVCGGGIVPGASILIGGDPGIGKSTLLLQTICHLATRYSCAYVSGEESVDQIRLRAARLGLVNDSVELAAATNVRDIIASMDMVGGPEIVIIDSIQTMFVDHIDSAPGTVTQVRSAAQELIKVAKRRGISLFLVGHVTKDGTIAGPRVLEHMVDTVLYFEGDRGHQFRILRAVKNRFGATDEIGVFQMTDRGLEEVANPSELFLAERRADISGSAVFAGIEGTRPVLVETQALVSPSSFATPRRAVIGWDSGRLSMILAVLETRCGVSFAGYDVYLNIAGGLRITEPAADLAIAAALLSARTGDAIASDTVIFGEIGLGGEVRGVGHQDLRQKEAAKLGFSKLILPLSSNKRSASQKTVLECTQLKSLEELMPLFNFDEVSQKTPGS